MLTDGCSLSQILPFLIAGLVIFDAPITSAQENSRPELIEMRQESPEVLRRQRLTIERELKDLITDLSQKRLELREISLLEINIKSLVAEATPRIDNEPDLVERTEQGQVFEGGLERAAQDDLDEAVPEFTDIGIDSLTTLAAKSLAVDIQSKLTLAALRKDVPSECRPDSPSENPTSEQIRQAMQKCLTAMEALLSEEVKLPEEISLDLTQAKADINNQIEAIESNIVQQESLLLEIEGLIGSSEGLTLRIVTITIPSVGILLALFILLPKFYESNIQEEIFSTKFILELLTVYILVSSILILGLANRIENEVLGTLLGGISGYVLGRSVGERRSEFQALSGKNDKAKPS